jgi:chemotaxis protein CheC
MNNLTEIQLDALRELANIGSGTAGTALSQLLGRPVDISVPKAAVLPLAEAVDSAGPADDEIYGVVLPIFGDLDATVLLLFPVPDATTLCGMLGVDPTSDDGRSALGEIGNILGSSYINALSSLTGMALEPSPPQVVNDMLAAIVSSVLMVRAHETDVALILDSNLEVEGEACSLSFLLLPSVGGVTELLSRIGMA